VIIENVKIIERPTFNEQLEWNARTAESTELSKHRPHNRDANLRGASAPVSFARAFLSLSLSLSLSAPRIFLYSPR